MKAGWRLFLMARAQRKQAGGRSNIYQFSITSGRATQVVVVRSKGWLFQRGVIDLSRTMNLEIEIQVFDEGVATFLR